MTGHPREVHVRLSELAFDSLQLDESATHADTAQHIAREIDDTSILCASEFVAGPEAFGALEFDVATDHFARCEEYARRNPIRCSSSSGRSVAACPVEPWSARTRREGRGALPATIVSTAGGLNTRW